jgi:hypothetical protein
VSVTASDLFYAKEAIVAASTLPHEALHIYAGLLIQLGMCILLGKRLSDWQPLYFVFAFELVNEVLDCIHIDHWLDLPFVHGMLWDFAHTCTIPTLIFVLARFTWIARR